MYGKIFASTFTGSMFGAGANVYAVWAYVLAHVGPDSLVELNPDAVAAAIGMQAAEVESVLERLCAPDGRSRNPEHEGRRLIPQGRFLYYVVSHARYLAIASEAERRAYNRTMKRKSRRKKDMSRLDLDMSRPVKRCQDRSSTVDVHVNVDVPENVGQTVNGVNISSGDPQVVLSKLPNSRARDYEAQQNTRARARGSTAARRRGLSAAGSTACRVVAAEFRRFKLARNQPGWEPQDHERQWIASAADWATAYSAAEGIDVREAVWRSLRGWRADERSSAQGWPLSFWAVDCSRWLARWIAEGRPQMPTSDADPAG